MRRTVTELTRKRAFATIREVAKAVLAGEPALSYSDLAGRIGMPNETGQGLGPILDEAALMCRGHQLPDVTSVVVTRDSLLRGSPFPSRDSSDGEGKWPLTGLHMDDVPAEQDRVRAFDWRSQSTLGLR